MSAAPAASIDVDANVDAVVSLGKSKPRQSRRMSKRASDGASAMIYQASLARKLSTQRSLFQDETYITSLIDDLRSALRELGASASLSELEAWAIFIHASLSGESRGYHNMDRIFEITAGADPFQLLCGLFRDTIHCFVDGGLSRKQLELLEGVTDDFVLTKEQDSKLGLIMALFALEGGQDLREFNGTDSFLSAVIASRVLQNMLAPSQLARIFVCMEATIPFRGPNESGATALETLHARLVHANESFNLALSETELVESIQRAADWSNRSLGNFTSEDAAVFLDHTWSLLPEQCTALRRSCLFSVNDFQLAISNMVDFLVGLDASRVLTSFRGVPIASEMETFIQHTNRNLDLGRKYMRAELLSVSIVASFASLTGGNGPMSFFTGDLPCANHITYHLGEDFDVFGPDDLEDGCEEQVYVLLQNGRRWFGAPDAPRRASPMAAFVYASLGEEGVLRALEHVSCPMTVSSARDLLSYLPYPIVDLIGKGVAEIAVSRTERIEQLLVDLSGDES